MAQKQVVEYFIEKGLLISPDLVGNIEFDFLNLYYQLNKKCLSKPLVLTKDLIGSLSKDKILDFNWVDFDNSLVLYQKERDDL